MFKRKNCTVINIIMKLLKYFNKQKIKDRLISVFLDYFVFFVYYYFSYNDYDFLLRFKLLFLLIRIFNKLFVPILQQK